MPTIVQINSVVNTGSTGRIVEQLGQLIISQGWTSYIAYGREARESKSQLIRIGSKFSVYTHALFSRIWDSHGLNSKRATKKILNKLDQIKPDIVHLHNAHGYYLNYPMLLKYLYDKNIPCIITLHDFWLMTGHCAYINTYCDKWKSGCGDCPRLSQYPVAMIDNSAKNWQLKAELFNDMPNVVLVSVSKWLNGFVQQSLLKNINSKVIYNGVDTEVFKPYDKKVSFAQGIDWCIFTIMCIATRWTEANGFNDVIKLGSLLPTDAQIIMVGLDDVQIRNLPPNIIGLKKTENFMQLQELYSKSSVVFNPNMEVTFGLVTVEAMACGTPVIVLKNTAGEELVNSETGYVVNTVDEVPVIIEQLKSKSRLEVSLSCRKRVIEHFNVKDRYQEYIDLYKGILNK